MSGFARFFDAYLECALWSSLDEDDEPLENNYGVDDINETSYKELRAECKDFFHANSELLAQHGTPERCGHDFWLTRNRHGAGFWDRGTGRVGDELTALSKLYGTCDLYVGDNGEIYHA